MGLLTLPFRLPFLPLQAVIRLAEVIGEQAEREQYSPARVRRELEEAQRRREAGEISDEELSRVANEATGSLLAPRPSAETAEDDDRS
jgi:transcriptional regulator NrdR family protein